MLHELNVVLSHHLGSVGTCTVVPQLIQVPYGQHGHEYIKVTVQLSSAATT